MWSFHVVVLQRTAKKCTKSYNARAQLLFCSLNLLFSDVAVAVAVVVFLNSLLLCEETLVDRLLYDNTKKSSKDIYLSGPVACEVDCL